MSDLPLHKPNRIYYIDNIRLFLTILVILHHTAIVYGGSGGWPLIDTPTDEISPIFLIMFNAINQTFFMSLFFMLSGYFVPRSFEKKGVGKFLADRFIRLGIPMLFFIMVISPFMGWMIRNFAKEQPVSIIDIFISGFKRIRWDIGPLWFLEVLLIFSCIFVLFRLILKKKFSPYKDSFPSNKAVIISILFISIGTFIVRIWYPVGTHFHVFQLGHYFHYAFCFWLGILVYRGKWFEKITNSQAKGWKITAIITVLIFPFMMAFIVVTGDKVEYYLGGFSWKSLLISVWDSIACLSIIISILSIFQNKFKDQGKLAKWMSPNFYIAYILHQPVIVVVTIPFLYVTIPSPVKFFIVGIISIFLCFFIGSIIRVIPGTKRVLG